MTEPMMTKMTGMTEGTGKDGAQVITTNFNDGSRIQTRTYEDGRQLITRNYQDGPTAVTQMINVPSTAERNIFYEILSEHASVDDTLSKFAQVFNDKAARKDFEPFVEYLQSEQRKLVAAINEGVASSEEVSRVSRDLNTIYGALLSTGTQAGALTPAQTTALQQAKHDVQVLGVTQAIKQQRQTPKFGG